MPNKMPKRDLKKKDSNKHAHVGLEKLMDLMCFFTVVRC